MQQKKAKKGRPKKNCVNFQTEGQYNFNRANVFPLTSLTTSTFGQSDPKTTPKGLLASLCVSQLRTFMEMLSTIGNFTNLATLHFCSNGIYIIADPKTSKIQMNAYVCTKLFDHGVINCAFTIQLNPETLFKKIKSITDPNSLFEMLFFDVDELRIKGQVLMRIIIKNSGSGSEFAEEIRAIQYTLPKNDDKKTQTDGIIMMYISDLCRCFKQIISTDSSFADLYCKDNAICFGTSHSTKSFIEKIPLINSDKFAILSPVSDTIFINRLQIKDLLKVLTKCVKHSTMAKIIFLADQRVVLEFDLRDYGAINYIVTTGT